ncbi:MAG: chorismate mutase [Mycobacterium sp.]
MTVRTLMVVFGIGVALTLGSGANEPIAKAEGPGPLAKLVDDAAQRLQTADPVAASKYLTGGAVDDPAREQQVIDSVTKAAIAKHVDPSFVHDVFRDQIDATDSLEHSRFAQWKIDPGSAPRTAPDLSSSRDVINRLNEAMVDDIAEQWNALHANTCPADLEDAQAAAIAGRHLDALYQQALKYAVHRYCR